MRLASQIHCRIPAGWMMQFRPDRRDRITLGTRTHIQGPPGCFRAGTRGDAVVAAQGAARSGLAPHQGDAVGRPLIEAQPGVNVDPPTVAQIPCAELVL
jgi:hypothetical protein